MSSTNRGSKRDLDDYYATPPDLALFLTRQLARDFSPAPVNVLEPGCGAGSFLQACRKTWPNALLEGVELSLELAESARMKGFDVRHDDIFKARLPDYHVILGNPPFTHAEGFIHKLRRHLDPDHGVMGFLLRLNFFGTRGRYQSLWSSYMPAHVYVLPARAGFTPDGKSDSIEYMFAVWRRESAPNTTLTILNNLNIANKWAPGAYEDPRGKWFPKK